MRTTAQEFASFESINDADLTTVSGGCGKKNRCCCPPPVQAAAPAPMAPPPGPEVSTNVSINYQ